MAAHRYPHKMNERERQMKARRSRFVSRGYRSAGRMVTFGLLQSLHGFSMLGFLKSVVVAALTIAAVCLFFAYLPWWSSLSSSGSAGRKPARREIRPPRAPRPGLRQMKRSGANFCGTWKF